MVLLSKPTIWDTYSKARATPSAILRRMFHDSGLYPSLCRTSWRDKSLM
jgi:hypothetical protein